MLPTELSLENANMLERAGYGDGFKLEDGCVMIPPADLNHLLNVARHDGFKDGGDVARQVTVELLRGRPEQ